MFQPLCAQERARAKPKAIFELRAATIIENKPMCIFIYIYIYIHIRTVS